MAKWKRIRKGIYYLNSSKKPIYAVISKYSKDHWSYGIYYGEASAKGLKHLHKGYLLERDAPNKEYAKWYAEKRLRDLEKY